MLDPSTRRQIRVALDHLGCRDLYDALGVTRDAPVSYIAARADAERQRWMKKAQVTAEKTAWLEIITHAQSHLGSPRTRARYDRTLAQEAEESFEGLAEFALKGLSRLDPGTRSALIEEAAALGIASERADRLIGRICRRLGVTREAGSVPPSPSSGLRCTPSRPRSPQRQRRRQVQPAAVPALRGRDRDEPGGAKGRLGAVPALRGVAQVGLPGLQAQPLGRRAAVRVRLPQALREPVVRHFEAAQHAFRNFDLTGALEHLDRVQEFAPNLAGARNGIAKVRQRQADITRVQARLRDGAGRRPAGSRPRGGRGLEPTGRPGIARAPGRLVRADPAACAGPRRWRPGHGTSNGPIRRRRETSIARAWPSPPTCPKPWPG